MGYDINVAQTVTSFGAEAAKAALAGAGKMIIAWRHEGGQSNHESKTRPVQSRNVLRGMAAGLGKSAAVTTQISQTAAVRQTQSGVSGRIGGSAGAGGVAPV